MKTKTLLVIIFLMSTFSTFAQRTIMREGNLTYVSKIEGLVQSLESTNAVGESYMEVHITPPLEEVQKMYRTIFSKERAAELIDYRFVCLLQFNTVTQELNHVVFLSLGDRKLRLTLKELNRLEKGYKSLKYKFQVVNDGIVKCFRSYSLPIIFKRIYDDQYWKQRE